MKITTFGLDLAKNVFQLHWVEPQTGEVKRRALKRDQMIKFFAQRSASVVARCIAVAGVVLRMTRR